MYNLKNKSFLRLLDFTREELKFLLSLSCSLKKAKYSGMEVKKLKGKSIALIFEKDSTRTRCAFEIAAYDQGAHTTYLGSSGSQIGKKESIKDTARVLGRMYDAIEFRGYEQEAVEILAKYSNVPVYNGLTDEAHPTQILADFMTIEEHKGSLKNVKLAFVGDAKNNVACSLMEGAAIMGMDFRICAPKELFPDAALIERVRKIASESGAKLMFSESAEEALKDVDAIYADVWVSMGETNWDEKIKMLKPYQVNKKLMSLAKEDALFLHCLPSFHNLETSMAREIFEKYGLKELEVSDEVFESKNSVVFEQAENRVHTTKAILVATLA